MVEVYGREAYALHRHGRSGVVTTSQAGLHDHKVHMSFLKGQKAQGCQKFEIGERRGRLYDLVGQFWPAFRLQHAVVDANPFAWRNKVGRGVQADVETVGAGQ